jgi:hypothetical protein
MKCYYILKLYILEIYELRPLIKALKDSDFTNLKGKSVRHYFTLPKINTTLIKLIAIDVLIIIY